MKFKRILSFAAASLITLSLMGCKRIKEGRIIDKQYSSSRTYVTMVKSGKSWRPITHYVPAHYYFTIEGIFYDGDERLDEFGTEEISVDEEIYESYHLGDMYRRED